MWYFITIIESLIVGWFIELINGIWGISEER